MLERLIHADTAPDCQTGNVDWYVEDLKQLIMVHISYKRPHYHNGQWKLHHNNGSPHVAQRCS